MLREFREFIARGNVIELAVGIVIGAAFKGVIDSFVNDILMPPLGLLTGGADFSNKFITIGPGQYASLAEAQAAGAATLNYGLFINQIISFLIVAFAVFLVVKHYNRLRERKDAAPAGPTEQECPFCKMGIPVAATRCGHCTSALAGA